MALICARRHFPALLPVRGKLCRHYSKGEIFPSDINKIFDQKRGQKITFNPICVSNCHFGKPFTEKGLEIYPYVRNYDTDRGVELTSDHKSDQRLVTYNLALENIFVNVFNMFNSLKNLKEHGFVRIADSEDSSETALPIFALASMFRFFANIDYHQRSLQTIKAKFYRLTEIDVTCILANHLIAPLVPVDGPLPNDVGCMVSSDGTPTPEICPCGQDCHEVVYGITEFGSEELWYGRPDIMVFPRSTGKVSISVNLDGNKSYKDAVSEKNRDKNIVKLKHTVNKEINPRQQLSVNSDKIQFCMQAITSSFLQMFYQKHRDIPECERVSLIPSIEFCSESFSIYMYDHIHDVFLKSNPVLLWKEKNRMTIDPYAVLVLWMMLNHVTLKPSLTRDMLDVLHRSCGLSHYLTDARLENIEKTFRVHEKVKSDDEYKHPEIFKYVDL